MGPYSRDPTIQGATYIGVPYFRKPRCAAEVSLPGSRLLVRIHRAGPADVATDLRAAAWLGPVGEFMIYEQWPEPVGLPRSKDGWNMRFRIINARIAYKA